MAENQAVASAFTTLINALGEEAVENRREFDRAVAFRKHVLTLEERWRAGQPPHTVRTPGKKAPASPEPEADPPPSSPPSIG